MWFESTIRTSYVEDESEKAYLIRMPSKSGYSEYSFWFSKRLIEARGNTGTYIRLIYSDDFKFDLRKYVLGQNNRCEIVDSIELLGYTMKHLLGRSKGKSKSSKEDV